MPCFVNPAGSPSCGGDVAVHVLDINQPSLPTPFFFCSCVYFCLYCPFNCISFHKFFRQLSAFSLCSFGLISALLVFSGRYFFTKVSFSPDIILCGRLGLKHELTNKPCFVHATKHDRSQRTTPQIYFCRSSLNDVSFRKLDLLLKET